jgi:hypothetical protein
VGELCGLASVGGMGVSCGEMDISVSGTDVFIGGLTLNISLGGATVTWEVAFPLQPTVNAIKTISHNKTKCFCRFLSIFFNLLTVQT